MIPRITCALAAWITLMLVNVRPTQAQEPNGAGPGRGVTSTTASDSGPLTIGAGQTVDRVAAEKRRVVIAGHVTGDVTLVDCDVTIEAGAILDKPLVAYGGRLDNRAGKRVHVVQQQLTTLSHLQQPSAHAATACCRKDTANGSPFNLTDAILVPANPFAKDTAWASGQFILLLCGVLSTMIVLLVGPNATQRTVNVLARSPRRSLGYGVVSFAALVVALLVSGALLLSPVQTLWLPFGAMLAVASCALLGYGWVCGMRQCGAWLLRRLGQSEGNSLFLQATLGLGVFFLLNVLLGRVATGLGVCSLLIEAGVAVMGLGAITLSRFGLKSAVQTAPPVEA